MSIIIHKCRQIIFYSVLFVFLFVGIRGVHAATLLFSPASQTLTVGAEFDVILRVDTRGLSINAVEGTISYPTNLLSGTSIDLTSSLITIWTQAPTFSSGTVQFSGGRQNPGFVGVGEVFRLKFRSSASGTATVRIQNAQVLLNDGNGTDVFESADNGVYTLQVVPPPPPPPPPAPVAPPEPAPAPTPAPSGGVAGAPVTPAEPAPASSGAAPPASPAPAITLPAPIRGLFEPVAESLVTPAQSIIEVAELILPAAAVARVQKAITVVQENKIYKALDTKIANNPAVEEATVKVAAPIIVTAAAANVVATASVARFMLYVQALFTQPFLFLTRRKRKSWGQVYSSLTKLPVDLAPVRLYESATGRLVRTRVTDKDGRYLFLVDPGIYKIEVTKEGFEFPTNLLRGKETDLDFTNLYHGGPLEVTSKSTTISKTIPLDPIEKTETPRSVVWRRRTRTLQKTVAWSGPVLAMSVVVIAPTPLTVGLLGVQFSLLAIFKRLAHGRMPRSWATVKDSRTGKTIALAVVRIFDTQFNKLLDTQVTDSYGRYAFLVGKGQFYITIDKPGYETHKSEVIDLTRGTIKDLIKRDIKLNPKSGLSGTAVTKDEIPPPPAPPAGAVGLPTVQNPSQADKTD